MYYCGLDLHAKSSAFCMVTARGRRVAEGAVPSTRSGFDKMLEHSEGDLVQVVLETSTRTRWASELRRVWIQAAQAALRMRSHPLKAWAQKLIYRRGRAVAVVALARRLFRWAFAMWRDGKHFDPKLAAAAAR